MSTNKFKGYLQTIVLLLGSSVALTAYGSWGNPVLGRWKSEQVNSKGQYITVTFTRKSVVVNDSGSSRLYKVLKYTIRGDDIAVKTRNSGGYSLHHLKLKSDGNILIIEKSDSDPRLVLDRDKD